MHDQATQSGARRTTCAQCPARLCHSAHLRRNLYHRALPRRICTTVRTFEINSTTTERGPHGMLLSRVEPTFMSTCGTSPHALQPRRQRSGEVVGKDIGNRRVPPSDNEFGAAAILSLEASESTKMQQAAELIAESARHSQTSSNCRAGIGSHSFSARKHRHTFRLCSRRWSQAPFSTHPSSSRHLGFQGKPNANATCVHIKPSIYWLHDHFVTNHDDNALLSSQLFAGKRCGGLTQGSRIPRFGYMSTCSPDPVQSSTVSP